MAFSGPLNNDFGVSAPDSSPAEQRGRRRVDFDQERNSFQNKRRFKERHFEEVSLFWAQGKSCWIFKKLLLQM